MDPTTQKPRYGARSRLVTRLLSRYMAEIGFTLDTPPLSDEAIDKIGSEAP